MDSSNPYLIRLLNKRGELRWQVRDILKYQGFKDLDEMRQAADRGDLWPESTRRYSVVGQALTCYLFPLYAAKVEERLTNRLNGGTYGKGKPMVYGFHGAGI